MSTNVIEKFSCKWFLYKFLCPRRDSHQEFLGRKSSETPLGTGHFVLAFETFIASCGGVARGGIVEHPSPCRCRSPVFGFWTCLPVMVPQCFAARSLELVASLLGKSQLVMGRVAEYSAETPIA